MDFDKLKETKFELAQGSIIQDTLEKYQRYFDKLVLEINDINKRILVLQKALLIISDEQDKMIEALSGRFNDVPNLTEPKEQEPEKSLAEEVDLSDPIGTIRKQLKELNIQAKAQPIKEKEGTTIIDYIKNMFKKPSGDDKNGIRKV